MQSSSAALRMPTTPESEEDATSNESKVGQHRQQQAPTMTSTAMSTQSGITGMAPTRGGVCGGGGVGAIRALLRRPPPRAQVRIMTPPVPAPAPGPPGVRDPTDVGDLMAAIERGFDSMHLGADGRRAAVPPSVRARRMVILLQVRVLLKLLAREDPDLRGRALRALRLCARKNLEGHPAFASLAACIPRALRVTVGEKRWTQAERCCQIILTSKNKQRAASAAAPAPGRSAPPRPRRPALATVDEEGEAAASAPTHAGRDDAGPAKKQRRPA